ncbi:methyltransferase [Beggiatoa sp. PS]|nr:methyltransferase [Beggiatoa sp. PS]
MQSFGIFHLFIWKLKKMTQWYEELFTNYAATYDKEVFTQGTLQETDFIEQELNHDKNKRILDIGCGTGRHAIELAKRGYTVTGIDLSESQLNRAKQKAQAEKVDITFQQADARHLQFSNEFDLAIMLCEGGFSLMETDEMNFAILNSATQALKVKDNSFLAHSMYYFLFTTPSKIFLTTT